MARLFDIRARGADPGEFCSFVELQRRVETIMANGDVQRSWITYATCWCSVRTASAREFISSQQSWPQSRRVLRTHWIDQVSIADRAVVDGRVFDVVGAADPDGRRAVIDIYVTEYAHDG